MLITIYHACLNYLYHYTIFIPQISNLQLNEKEDKPKAEENGNIIFTFIIYKYII